jgi:hemin uptake protein HemP
MESKPQPATGPDDCAGPVPMGPISVGPTHPDPRLPKIISFRELCRCGDEVWIENSGDLYRLRRTKQGKLILTK